MENKNKNIIKIIDEKKNERECEMILTVFYEKTGKDYIIFTDHEIDDAGNLQAYAGIYDAKGEDLNIKPVTTDDEWDMLQTLLTSSQKIVLKDKMKDEK